jgi:hypothetical protein
MAVTVRKENARGEEPWCPTLGKKREGWSARVFLGLEKRSSHRQNEAIPNAKTSSKTVMPPYVSHARNAY